MKKISIIFIFFIVLITAPVYAKTEVAPTESIPIPTQSLAPSPTPIMIDYQLPYPGILPGNSLYPLKMIRDRIMEFLISDPLKKSNFYLLQADKRLASSLMLFDKGEEELGQTTLSKGQKYLEKSLDKAIEAKKSKKDVGDIFARIKNSATKQKQEIEKLGGKSKDMAQKLKGDLLKAQSIEKGADILIP